MCDVTQHTRGACDTLTNRRPRGPNLSSGLSGNAFLDVLQKMLAVGIRVFSPVFVCVSQETQCGFPRKTAHSERSRQRAETVAPPSIEDVVGKSRIDPVDAPRRAVDRSNKKSSEIERNRWSGYLVSPKVDRPIL